MEVFCGNLFYRIAITGQNPENECVIFSTLLIMPLDQSQHKALIGDVTSVKACNL